MMRARTKDAAAKQAELTQRFPGVSAIIAEPGLLTVTAVPDQLVALLTFLQEDPGFGFGQLTDLTAIDYPAESQIVVVYRLSRIPEWESVVVKLKVARENGEAPSVTGLWGNANWLEREVFDMFGVRFVGHPDLRRILTWESLEGHPLRKDFALPEWRHELEAEDEA